MRKVTCEVYLSTHSVGYSGSLSTVNVTNCNQRRFELEKSCKYENCELTSHSIRMRTTSRNLDLKANISILYVDQLERWTGKLRRNAGRRGRHQLQVQARWTRVMRSQPLHRLRTVVIDSSGQSIWRRGEVRLNIKFLNGSLVSSSGHVFWLVLN